MSGFDAEEYLKKEGNLRTWGEVEFDDEGREGAI